MSIKKEILDELKYEDLPENFQLVAEACGMDIVKSLIIELGGFRMDIPQARSLKKTIARYMKKSDEVPIRKVAQELSLTERCLRRLEE